MLDNLWKPEPSDHKRYGKPIFPRKPLYYSSQTLLAMVHSRSAKEISPDQVFRDACLKLGSNLNDTFGSLQSTRCQQYRFSLIQFSLLCAGLIDTIRLIRPSMPIGLFSGHHPPTADIRGQMSLDSPRPSGRRRTSRPPSTAWEQVFSMKPRRTS